MRVGVDIVSVKRIEKAFQNENFKHKVFSIEEINYCESRKNKYEHYAGKFAAKEAYAKALGTGFKNGLSFLDIKVINDEDGRPNIISEKFNVNLSISHEREYAVAFVVLEEKYDGN